MVYPQDVGNAGRIGRSALLAGLEALGVSPEVNVRTRASGGEGLDKVFAAWLGLTVNE